MDQKSLGAPPQQNSKKPVVSEQYDEAVFTDPTESFKRLLMLYSTFSVDTRAADAAGMVGTVVSLVLICFFFPLIPACCPSNPWS